MIHLIKTNHNNLDFIKLVNELDTELEIIDGDDHDFYHQYNNIDNLSQVIIAYHNNQAVGCGALKPYNKLAMEIKRMYVPEVNRGLGIATKILNALELWAKTLGYKKCVLETGKTLIGANALYKKCGYKIIPNYEQYIGVNNSICFEKIL